MQTLHAPPLLSSAGLGNLCLSGSGTEIELKGRLPRELLETTDAPVFMCTVSACTILHVPTWDYAYSHVSVCG